MNRSKSESINKNSKSINKNSKSKNTSNKKSMTPEVIDLKEIIGINDMNEKKESLNGLINHILLNNCPINKCHNLSQLLQELTSNLINLMNFDISIDKLIAEYKWTQSNDNEIENSFCQLICESIHLKPFKCVHILENIVIPKFKGFAKFEIENENEITSQEMIIFDKIHSLLSQIKIAKFESILLKTIDKSFPFAQFSSNHSFNCFVYNVLKIYDYVIERQKLISILFDKLLWIDSMCSSDKKSNSVEEVFNIDDCDYVKSAPNVSKLIEKLDQSIELVFKFIDNKTSDMTSEESLELFKMFESLFCKIILTAENCHHLQYILLYFCSFSKLYCDQFIQTLWKIGLNNELPLKTREKALYYINSLLKNAKFVSINTLLSFMDTTSRWIHSYIDTNDSINNELSSEDTIFYVLCQILFDIFCSTHTEFDNSSLRRVKAMNFQRIIKCNLNPLSFSSRDIEVKFLCLARHYQIGYCSQNVKRDDERVNRYPVDHLNGFNAFSSYILPKSYKKIEQICKYSMNGDYSLMNEIEKYNRYSDESDHMIGSYKLSYSPSKTLLYDLLSDSSPNEQMDFD